MSEDVDIGLVGSADSADDEPAPKRTRASASPRRFVVAVHVSAPADSSSVLWMGALMLRWDVAPFGSQQGHQHLRQGAGGRAPTHCVDYSMLAVLGLQTPLYSSRRLIPAQVALNKLT